MIRRLAAACVQDTRQDLLETRRSLGMSISRLATYSLMAGVLHAPSLSAPKYRKAMVDTLRQLKEELAVVGARRR